MFGALLLSTRIPRLTGLSKKHNMGQNQSQPGPVNGAPKENGHLKSVHFVETSRQSAELTATAAEDSTDLTLKAAEFSVQTEELSVETTELSAETADLSTQITEPSEHFTEPLEQISESSEETSDQAVPIPNIGYVLSLDITTGGY